MSNEQMTKEEIERQLSSLNRRLGEVEKATADTGTYGQRLHAFKNEIKRAMDEYRQDVGKLLAKHNEERTEQEKSFEAHFNYMGSLVQTVMQGLHRLEARSNLIWNTFNGLVRMLERVWSRQDPCPASRTEFEELFKASGRQVWDESMAYEKAELARMREEKKTTGKVQKPMAARDASAADVVMKDQGQLIAKTVDDNRADFEELSRLRMEAAGADLPPVEMPVEITNKQG